MPFPYDLTSPRCYCRLVPGVLNLAVAADGLAVGAQKPASAAASFLPPPPNDNPNTCFQSSCNSLSATQIRLKSSSQALQCPSHVNQRLLPPHRVLAAGYIRPLLLLQQLKPLHHTPTTTSNNNSTFHHQQPPLTHLSHRKSTTPTPQHTYQNHAAYQVRARQLVVASSLCPLQPPTTVAATTRLHHLSAVTPSFT